MYDVAVAMIPPTPMDAKFPASISKSPKQNKRFKSNTERNIANRRWSMFKIS